MSIGTEGSRVGDAAVYCSRCGVRLQPESAECFSCGTPVTALADDSVPSPGLRGAASAARRSLQTAGGRKRGPNVARVAGAAIGGTALVMIAAVAATNMIMAVNRITDPTSPAGGPALPEVEYFQPDDAGRVLATIATGRDAQDVAITPDGSTAFATSFVDGRIVRFDLATFQIGQTVSVGRPVSAVAVSADGQQLYVGTGDGDAPGILVLDPWSLNETGAFAVGGHPTMLVAVPGSGDVLSVRDGGSVARRTVAGERPVQAWIGSKPWAVWTTMDATTTWVSVQSDGGRIVALDAATLEVLGAVDIGGRPAYLTASPDGRRVYAVRADAADIAVIDAASMTVVDHWEVGGVPWGISISPDGNYLYVCDNANARLLVMSTAGGSIIDRIEVGVHPTFVVVSPDGGLVLVPARTDDSVTVIRGYSLRASGRL